MRKVHRRSLWGGYFKEKLRKSDFCDKIDGTRYFFGYLDLNRATFCLENVPCDSIYSLNTKWGQRHPLLLCLFYKRCYLLSLHFEGHLLDSLSSGNPSVKSNKNWWRFPNCHGMEYEKLERSFGLWTLRYVKYYICILWQSSTSLFPWKFMENPSRAFYTFGCFVFLWETSTVCLHAPRMQSLVYILSADEKVWKTNPLKSFVQDTYVYVVYIHFTNAYCTSILAGSTASVSKNNLQFERSNSLMRFLTCTTGHKLWILICLIFSCYCLIVTKELLGSYGHFHPSCSLHVHDD